MPFGWTQQSQKWTVWKNNNDTTITYNFTKEGLTNFRVYVTNLEKFSDLYKIEVIESSKKDSLLNIKDQRIINRDSVIVENKKFILYQQLLLLHSLFQ